LRAINFEKEVGWGIVGKQPCESLTRHTGILSVQVIALIYTNKFSKFYGHANT